MRSRSLLPIIIICLLLCSCAEPEEQVVLVASPTMTSTAQPTLQPTEISSPTPEATSTEVSKEPQLTVNVNAANIRSGPSTNDGVIGTIRSGEYAEILSSSDDGGWYHIKLSNGLIGWVGRSVAVITEPVFGEEPQDDTVEGEKDGIIVANQADDNEGEYAEVVRIVDGDTIEVSMNGQVFPVRYIGIDTAEYNEPCGPEATHANARLVEGQTVRMEKDVNETDPYDRLLRYVYVGDLFVNAELVRLGWAEPKRYPPDTSKAEYLESQKAGAPIPSCQTVVQPTSPTPAVQATEPPPAVAQPTNPPASTTGPVVIVRVDKRAEFVDIENQGSTDINLGGWMLRSEKGNQDCNLGGMIAAGQRLRIWAMAADAGQGGFNCGFGSNIWNNSEHDPAVLFENGVEVSRR